MRAIPLRCPNCGASLNAAETAPTVTCAYCQTTSRVRARTAFFEAPAKLPEAPEHLSSLPIATQTHSKRWMAGCGTSLALFVGAMALIPFLVINKVRKAATGTDHDGVSARTLNWRSYKPLAADVNGDGVADLLGRMSGLEGPKTVHLVAFDGASGKRLWRSEKLGVIDTTSQGSLALLGDRLVFVSPRGLARSYKIADGSASWKLKLGEKLDEACRDDAGTYLITADERWVSIDTDSGKATEARPRQGCEPLPTDSSRQDPVGLQIVDTFDRHIPVPDEIEGMAINANVIIEGNQRIALGYKSPGTAIPMVARYAVKDYDPPAESEIELLERETGDLPKDERQKVRRRQRKLERALRKKARRARFEVVYKTQVPSRDPLSAESSRTEHFGISREADCIAVPYEVRNKPIQVACISYKTGEHRWDIKLPKAFIDTLHGITVTDKRAFVCMSSRVHVLDLASGKRIVSVGQNN